MIQYKKINVKDKEKLIRLIDEVLTNLERKDFFIPFTDDEIEEMFDNNKVIIYGAYDEDKLIGTAQLYYEQSYIGDIKKIINLKSDKVAELGGYLVLENYRNQGIMKNLEKILIKEASNLNLKYIVITVHPDNIASNKTTESTGAKIVKKALLGEYLRNIYLLEV